MFFMKMDLLPSEYNTSQQFGSHSTSSSLAFSQVLVVINPNADRGLILTALSQYSDDINFTSKIESAYAQFYSTLYDLVLCDLSLSGSLEFLSSISGLRPSLPIIAIADSNQLEGLVSTVTTSDLSWIIKDGREIKDQIIATAAIIAKRSSKTNSEIELHTERNAYWAATNCAPEGVAILGEDGTIVFANEKFSSFIAGIKSDTACSNIVELISFSNSLVAETLLAQLNAAPSGSVWQSEVQITANGTGNAAAFYEITLSVSDISSSSGAIASYLSSSNLRRRVLWVKDITVQKEQEQFLRDLVSTTSHDLKGPLGAISNAAEMLSETEDLDPETFKVLTNAIYSCSRKSIAVIDELLKCPSIKVSALRLTKVSLPLGTLIKDLVADFIPTAMTKNIKLTVGQIDPEIWVSVDKVAIYRALGNLLSNALKFSRTGESVDISIRSNSVEFIAISFKDSGPGIEAGEMGQLFQRFGRLNRTKLVEGTGLGLFAVKNIIDAHQGRVEVESELGVGATFTVLLPTSA